MAEQGPEPLAPGAQSGVWVCCLLGSRWLPGPSGCGAAVHGSSEDPSCTAGAGWGLAAAVIQQGREAGGGDLGSREPPLGARAGPLAPANGLGWEELAGQESGR